MSKTTHTKKPTGYVIYDGPSLLDGKRIPARQRQRYFRVRSSVDNEPLRPLEFTCPASHRRPTMDPIDYVMAYLGVAAVVCASVAAFVLLMPWGLL